MAKSARTEAYTLVELMIVVTIIGTLAALSAPRVNQQLIERKTNQIQLSVVRHFREARFAAIGYGHAYRVVFSQTASSGRGSLTFERGSTSRCNNATTFTATQPAYSPLREERSGSPVYLKISSPALTAAEICFTPMGVMYWRPDSTARFTDKLTSTTATLKGGFVFTITNSLTGSVTRRVVLPLGGTARVLQ